MDQRRAKERTSVATSDCRFRHLLVDVAHLKPQRLVSIDYGLRDSKRGTVTHLGDSRILRRRRTAIESDLHDGAPRVPVSQNESDDVPRYQSREQTHLCACPHIFSGVLSISLTNAALSMS